MEMGAFFAPENRRFPRNRQGGICAYHPAFENAAQRRKWAKIAPKLCQNERLTETPGVLLFKAASTYPRPAAWVKNERRRQMCHE